MSAIKTSCPFILFVAMVMTLGACSKDRHRFYSSVDRPTNLTLYDPFSNTPLWEKRIPVGQTLELDFDRENENESKKVSQKPATQFTWKLYTEDPKNPLAEDIVLLPGTPIVMKVTYRPSPEYPPGYNPNPR